jgi:hypothetical protein
MYSSAPEKLIWPRLHTFKKSMNLLVLTDSFSILKPPINSSNSVTVCFTSDYGDFIYTLSHFE